MNTLENLARAAHYSWYEGHPLFKFMRSRELLYSCSIHPIHMRPCTGRRQPWGSVLLPPSYNHRPTVGYRPPHPRRQITLFTLLPCTRTIADDMSTRICSESCSYILSHRGVKIKLFILIDTAPFWIRSLRTPSSSCQCSVWSSMHGSWMQARYMHHASKQAWSI